MPRNPLPLLLSALVLCLPAAARADRVDDYLQGQMLRNHIPGLSVAVVRNGKTVKLKAYGKANLEWDARAAPDTAYQLASATKPLTGTALMLLVQDGKLRLDDPVSRYLPEAPPAWREITLRHLASHTSGIPDNLGGAPANSVAEAVAAAAKLPLEYAPGTRSSYGLTGYIVLSRIIEQVTGRPFPAFLRERLLDPLEMRDTRFDDAWEGGPIRTAALVPHRAGVYEWDGERQKGFSFLFAAHSYSAGGLYASAADLAKWVTALDGGRLLNSASLSTMWTPQRLSGGAETGFGLGWATGTYRGRRTVGHSGGPALADLLRFPEEKLTIIVLANQQRMYPYLAQGVADLYLSAPRIEETAIPDRDEKTTQALYSLLAGFGEGKVDPEPFAPPARQALVGAVQQFAMPFFRSLEPLRKLTLLEEKTEGGLRVRRYRAWYGQKPVLWRFDLDADGKITMFQPSPE